MEKTFNIKTVRDTLNISGDLNLSNAPEIWGKLNKLSDKIKKIKLTGVKTIDISFLQQLILIKSKKDYLAIIAEIPESITSVLENCQMTNIFSSLTIKN